MGEGIHAVGDGGGLQISIEGAVLFGCVKLADKTIVELERVGIAAAGEECSDLDPQSEIEFTEAHSLDAVDIAAFDDRHPEGKGVLFFGGWGRRRDRRWAW